MENDAWQLACPMGDEVAKRDQIRPGEGALMNVNEPGASLNILCLFL